MKLKENTIIYINDGVNMNLNEAQEILKNHGFLCEAEDVDVENLKEGDKYLLWVAGKYQYRPIGIITLLEPDTYVQRQDKGSAWICEIQKAESGPIKYEVGEHIAYTHGTYGDAIVYPAITWEHTYKIGNETTEQSLKFFKNGKVWYKTEQKNLAFKEIKNRTYYITKDLDKMNKYWWDYSEDGNSITNPREIEEVFEEHPELRKEFEGKKRRYYDLHTKKE